MAFHYHLTAEDLVIVIEGTKLVAFIWRQKTFDDGVTFRVESEGNLPPLNVLDSFVNSVNRCRHNS